MMKYLVLLFLLQAGAQEQNPADAVRAKEFEQMTGIRLGQYEMSGGDRNVCRSGGTLRVFDLENRFTLAIGQMGLVYSLGIEEVVWEEGKCKNVDRSTFKKDEVKQHSEITCEGEPLKVLDVVVQKTRRGFKYRKTVSVEKTVVAEEKCEYRLR